MSRAGRTWPWALVPTAIAAALFARTLSAGFLSDDLLLNYLLDLRTDPVQVDWSQVAADFARPWLGLEGGVLYRPIMTVSYALDLATGGGTALSFHLTNVAAHVGSTACVAVLCGWLAPRRARLATLLGGTLFAVHPAATETVAWISGRVSGLEQAWSLLALTCFVRHLRTGRAGGYIAVFPLALLALLTKESAVVLPVSLAAVDALHGILVRPRPVSTLLRRQLGFVPIWVFYLALRLAALGRLGGPTMQETAGPPLESFLATLVPKLVLLGQAYWPLLVLTGALVGVAAWHGATTRSLRFGLVVQAAWILAQLVPSYQIRVAPPFGGGRVVYGIVPCLALLIAAYGLPRQRLPVGPALGVLLVGGSCLASWTQLDRFARAWRTVDDIRGELQELGAGASPGRPLAVVATPAQRQGIPILNPNAVFPLCEIPHAPRNIPFIGLNFVLVHIPDAHELYLDASPLRTLWRHGIRLLSWKKGRFQSEGPSAAPSIELRRSGEDRFEFARPISPYHIDSLVLTVRGKSAGGTLRWFPSPYAGNASWTEHSFGAGRYDGDRTVFRLDLTHSIPFLAHEQAGGIRGFEIRLDHARVEGLHLEGPGQLALVRQLRDSELTLGEEARSLTAPRPQNVRRQLRCVLLGPHAGHAFPVEPDQPVTFPPRVAADLRRIDRVYRQKRFWYYFEARSPTGASFGGARSELDWFLLRVPHR